MDMCLDLLSSIIVLFFLSVSPCLSAPFPWSIAIPHPPTNCFPYVVVREAGARIGTSRLELDHRDTDYGLGTKFQYDLHGIPSE